LIIALIISLVLLLSVPYLYSKANPSVTYQGWKVVDLNVGAWNEYCTMTVEKQGQKWSVPVSSKIHSQIHVGTTIDFYYNHDEPVHGFQVHFEEEAK
jgi:hypothetical protein